MSVTARGVTSWKPPVLASVTISWAARNDSTVESSMAAAISASKRRASANSAGARSSGGSG